MKLFSCRNIFFLLLFVCLAGLGGSLAYFLFSLGFAVRTSGLTAGEISQTATVQSMATPGITPVAGVGCTQTKHNFESGIVLPRWSNSAYGGGDANWLKELPQMKTQTSACWEEMPVLFEQTSFSSTNVYAGASTPDISSLVYGIRYAHAQGFHVFVTLLVSVTSGNDHWVGKVKLPTLAQQQQWFASYWQAIQPYIVAAQQAGAEQLSIGTEIQWLEDNAPASLWNNLISQVHSAFSGTLTYDVNWSALSEPPLPWMSNPFLKMIGISAYAPILTTAQHLDPQQMPPLWASKVQTLIDHYSIELKAPIFISEIGYRDTVDAFYLPWQSSSSAAIDPQEQQGACAAVLQNVLSDPHILGSFFWAWDGAGKLNLKNSLAAQTIKHYYQPLSTPA
jgi:hypothetical protein